MLGSYTLKPRRCPICQTTDHVCGDSHMRRGPIDNVADGGIVTQPEPQELREYTYVINNQHTTALLTEEMAKALKAEPVDSGVDPEVANGGYTSSQNAAVYSATNMGGGVTGDLTTEPVRPQQMGVSEEGRTRSMLPPPESGAEPAPEPVEGEGRQMRSPSTSTTTDGEKSGVEPNNKARRGPQRDK